MNVKWVQLDFLGYLIGVQLDLGSFRGVQMVLLGRSWREVHLDVSRGYSWIFWDPQSVGTVGEFWNLRGVQLEIAVVEVEVFGCNESITEVQWNFLETSNGCSLSI